MAYEIQDKTTGETEVLSEQEAEAKYGAVEFTMMVAGINDTHSAVNLSVDEAFDFDDIGPRGECDVDILEAFL